MPWYMYPAITCRVLNRIANRNPHASLREIHTMLDCATQSIWNKQERYYETVLKNPSVVQGYAAGNYAKR